MPSSADALRNTILSFLSGNPEKAYRPKEISRALGLKSRARYRAFLDALDGMERDGEVRRVRGGRLQVRPKSSPGVEGLIRVNRQGHGFVQLDDGTEVFVRQGRLQTALDGDRVRVEVAAADSRQDPDRLRDAQVLAVVERGRAQTVGTFTTSGSAGWVKPDDNRVGHDVYVPQTEWNGASTGDKVVASIDRFDDPKSSPEGRVLSVLGRADAPGVDVLAVAIAHGVKPSFPDEVERDAERIDGVISDKEVARRLDLRDAPIFTIDPEDAKDFDDAIHTRDLGGGKIEVGVHIADVSHYVAVGSALDAEAYERATSTYLVDRVIPMLPEALSNGVCSLRPREDKLCYSCILVLDADSGEVEDWSIRQTVIHSKERFTYQGAQDVLDGADHPLADEVRRAGALARTLTAKRMREGALDFDVPEVRIRLNNEGQPVDVYVKERQAANRLIEELMLLANTAVAREAEAREKALVYRIHGAPDRERIAALAEYVRPFGYTLKEDGGEVKRSDLNRLLKDVQGTPEAAVIEQAAIRAMQKAVYSPDNIGHYGLGFESYAHFTSPIRRYPDLIVHRLLKRYHGEGRGLGAAPTESQLEDWAKHCSEREREATEAERESVKLKQVEYAAQHIGDAFNGVVTGVTKFGVFVEMTALLTTGLAHVRDMDGDFWEYDAGRYALIGRRTGRRIQAGAACRVRIAAAEPESRRIDLVFETMPGESTARRGVAGRSKKRPGSKAKRSTRPDGKGGESKRSGGNKGGKRRRR